MGQRTTRRAERRAGRVRPLRRLGVGAVIALCALGAAGSASAASPIPLPPLPSPTVPPQLAPVLNLLSPVVSPECGNLGLTAALILPALGGDLPGGLPFDPTPLFAPILAICGAVPAPGEELSCQADSTIAALAGQGISSILGAEDGLLTKILNLSLFGQITEEVYVVQAVAPSQLQGVNLGSLIQNALMCTKIGSSGPELGTAPPSLSSPSTPVSLPPLATSPASAPSSSSSSFALGAVGDGTPSTGGLGAPSSTTTTSPPGAAAALPQSTGLASQIVSPSSTIAEGGALIGFLLLLSGAVALYLRSRRAVSGSALPPDGE